MRTECPLLPAVNGPFPIGQPEILREILARYRPVAGPLR